MSTTAVRISRASHEKLRQLAEKHGHSLAEELDRIIEAQRRNDFLEEANRAYARLRQDPERWAAFQEELEEWDSTMMDGLENEPPYFARTDETGDSKG